MLPVDIGNCPASDKKTESPRLGFAATGEAAAEGFEGADGRPVTCVDMGRPVGQGRRRRFTARADPGRRCPRPGRHRRLGPGREIPRRDTHRHAAHRPGRVGRRVRGLRYAVAQTTAGEAATRRIAAGAHGAERRGVFLPPPSSKLDSPREDTVEGMRCPTLRSRPGSIRRRPTRR